MNNLTGNYDCDKVIRTELQSAGITVVVNPTRQGGDVPATLTGKLTRSGLVAFTFTRFWYYWVVKGNVPLEVAEEMFADPLGKRDVRVAGMAGNDDPKNWALPSGDDVAAYLKENGRSSVNCAELIKLCNNGKITAKRFIQAYHIDTQEGLELFVSTLRKYGLAD